MVDGEVIPLDDVGDVSARVVTILRAGGVVVLPTDTVYAVVADAFQPAATRRIAECKGRDARVPLTVLIRSPRQVAGLVADVPEAAERLMASYWPGPLTLRFPAADGLSWDLGHTGGTVALRMPPDDLVLAVVAEIGPLACSGANLAGESAAETADRARAQLGATVSAYVDGGRRAAEVSTIVDVTAPEAVVLRAGSVPADHVVAVADGRVPWGARPDDDAAHLEPEPGEG